jgi:hypothetical protein
VSRDADFFLKARCGGDAAKDFTLSRQDAKRQREISCAEGAINLKWRFAPKKEQNLLASWRLSVKRFGGDAAHKVPERAGGRAC